VPQAACAEAGREGAPTAAAINNRDCAEAPRTSKMVSMKATDRILMAAVLAAIEFGARALRADVIYPLSAA
jgi:hypothetical protein